MGFAAGALVAKPGRGMAGLLTGVTGAIPGNGATGFTGGVGFGSGVIAGAAGLEAAGAVAVEAIRSFNCVETGNGVAGTGAGVGAGAGSSGLALAAVTTALAVCAPNKPTTSSGT